MWLLVGILSSERGCASVDLVTFRRNGIRSKTIPYFVKSRRIFLGAIQCVGPPASRYPNQSPQLEYKNGLFCIRREIAAALGPFLGTEMSFILPYYLVEVRRIRPESTLWIRSIFAPICFSSPPKTIADPNFLPFS